MMRAPLIIISGPAGSGKSTLIRAALASFGTRLRHAISATTRAPRGTEQDGVHYHFVDVATFEADIAAGNFLEYAQVFGKHYYGTPVREVEPYRAQGVGVIVDVDVQGAAQLRGRCPDAYSVFIDSPPGAYEQRLRTRGEDSEEAIQRRLEEAQREIARANEFQHRIMNDSREQAAAELCAVIHEQFTRLQQGTGPCSTI
jgi:guanylate kinase